MPIILPLRHRTRPHNSTDCKSAETGFESAETTIFINQRILKVSILPVPRTNKLEKAPGLHKKREFFPSLLYIKKIENIFSTASGLCFTYGGFLEDSAYHYIDRRNKYLTSVLLNFFAKKRLHVDSPASIIAGYYCPGYYHWLTEALPRLLTLVEHSTGPVKVMIPDHYPGYVNESIAIGFPEVEVIKFDKSYLLYFPKMNFVSHPAHGSSIGSQAATTLRQIFTLQKHSSQSEKVYISRAKSRGRKIVSEEALFEALKSQGYKKYFFEEMSFLEQVRLMNSAAEVISIHGAGLTNILFMPAGGKVTEISGDFDNENAFNHSYMQLAGVLELEYAVYFAKVKQRHFAHDNYDVEIDIDDFNQFLNEK